MILYEVLKMINSSDENVLEIWIDYMKWYEEKKLRERGC